MKKIKLSGRKMKEKTFKKIMMNNKNNSKNYQNFKDKWVDKKIWNTSQRKCS